MSVYLANSVAYIVLWGLFEYLIYKNPILKHLRFKMRVALGVSTAVIIERYVYYSQDRFSNFEKSFNMIPFGQLIPVYFFEFILDASVLLVIFYSDL